MDWLTDRLLRVPRTAPTEAAVVLCSYLAASVFLANSPISPLALALLAALVWSYGRRLSPAFGRGTPRAGSGISLLWAGIMISGFGGLILWLDGSPLLMHLFSVALLIPVIQAFQMLSSNSTSLPPSALRQVAQVHVITASLLILANTSIAFGGNELHWIIFRALAPAAFFLLRDLLADLTVSPDD